jgi:hypothetical protein
VRDAIPVCTVARVLFDLSRALELHRSGSAGTRSGLEDRFLKLIRGARLSEPVVNTHHLGFELDFRWPGLNVEIARTI